MPDTPEPPDEIPPVPRPATIEFAAAILIVGGLLGSLGAGAAAADLPAGTEPLLVVTIVLDVLSVVTGVLIRMGRAWVIAVNYVAVLGFLDLMAAGGSGLALILGVADVLVVVILFLNKPWFDARRGEREARRTGLRAGDR
jgi:uncharacterized membrane protein